MSAEIEVQADPLKSLTVDTMFPNTDVHVVMPSSYDRALKEEFYHIRCPKIIYTYMTNKEILQING